ncbi:MAG: hypothetical protein KZQ99_10115 [Candidatus Thiodiazotropha sp. (ex Dulcina madagascariensis)]|nr:hypothetical protein [Candidatus Thiodiazotropha sp. (ex Dulcina madagascariensis)]
MTIAAITACASRVQCKNILEAGWDEVMGSPFQTHEISDTTAEHLKIRYIDISGHSRVLQ